MGATKKCLCAFVRKYFEGRELLEKQVAGLRLNGGERDALLDPANDKEPCNFRIVYVGNAGDHRHRLERQIEIGRVAGKPVAVVTLRCDADNGDWLRVDAERASDDAGIRGVVVRPRVVAHDGSKGSDLADARSAADIRIPLPSRTAPQTAAAPF